MCMGGSMPTPRQPMTVAQMEAETDNPYRTQFLVQLIQVGRNKIH